MNVINRPHFSNGKEVTTDYLIIHDNAFRDITRYSGSTFLLAPTVVKNSTS